MSVVTYPFHISAAEFLAASKDGQAGWAEIDRRDGKPGDATLDIGRFADELEDGVARDGMEVEDDFYDAIRALGNAAKNAAALGLPSADTFAQAHELVDDALARGWLRFSSGGR
jgi:hypothetical protein